MIRGKFLALSSACVALGMAGGALATDGLGEPAESRGDGLRLSVYVTAGSVAHLATEANDSARVVELLRSLGVRRVFLEVYRSGRVIEIDTGKKALRERYAAAGRERLETHARQVRQARADHLLLRTDRD